jgi:hypothetical protein
MHVRCVVCSWIPRKHSGGKLYAQGGVFYVRDIVPYKKHRYSTCQANDGSVRGPCVLAMRGYSPMYHY